MTRRPVIATGAALALMLGLLPVLVAPAADAATAPAVGAVFVADTGNNRVVEIAPDGTQQDVGSGFSAPQGVAVDAAGNVFVADTGNNRIVEVPANGGAQITVGTGFKAPTAVTVAQGGVLFVIDAGDKGEVVQMNEDGSGQAELTGDWIYGPPVAVAVGGGYIWVLLGDCGCGFEPGALIQISLTDHQDVTLARSSDTVGADAGFTIAPDGSQDQSEPVSNLINVGGVREIGTGLNNPEGLALTPSGDLVVADNGNNRVVRMATDGSNQTTIGSGFSRPIGVAVYAPPPTFTAASPPSPFLAGEPYSYTFKATAPAGEPAPVMEYVGGSALPLGLTLDSATGTLAGTPEESFPLNDLPEGAIFQVQAANGATATVITVNITMVPTLFTADSPPTSTHVGDAYSYTFAAEGAAPVTFSAHGPVGDSDANVLPPGLTLDPATGVLSGTPTVAGEYQFLVRAANAHGYTDVPSDAAAYYFDVVPRVGDPPGVTVFNPADGTNFPLGSSPAAFFSCLAAPDTRITDCSMSIDGGAPLMDGQLLVASPGPHTAVVTGTQSDGKHTSVTVHYTMGNAGPPSVSVTTPTDGASYTVGSVPDLMFACTAGSNGTLKDGLDGCSASIDGGAAVASGTALAGATGPHTVVVTATDTDGQHSSLTRNYTVTAPVGAPSITVTTPVDNASYASGSVPGLAFTCTAGSNGGTLKDGLAGCSASIDGGAAVASGTALAGATGPHTVMVTATDTDGQHASVTRNYTVTAVVGPPSVTVTTPSDGASYPFGSVPNTAFTCTAGTNGALKPGLAGCSASIDGGAAVASGTALAGASGPHTVVVTAADTDGQHASVTRNYTVTASAPSVSVTRPVENAGYAFGAVPTAAFGCTAGGGGTLKAGLAGCSASIDGGPAVASGTALAGSAGAHTITVTATDTDGQHTSATGTTR